MSKRFDSSYPNLFGVEVPVLVKFVDSYDFLSNIRDIKHINCLVP